MSKAILFVDHATGIGGAEKSLLMLLRHLSPQRWQPYLACSAGPLLAAAASAGIRTYATQFPRLRRSLRFPLDWVLTARWLAQLSRENDAVVLYANTVRAAFYTALAARLARRPFIWHMRDFWLSESEPRIAALDSFVKRLLLQASTVTIVNSEAVGDHLPSSGKLHVVRNGIEIERFDPRLNGGVFRKHLGVPPAAPLVGMVGRLRPWKGQDRFLRVAKQVLVQVPDTHFLIVGGSPLGSDETFRCQLEQLAVELGIQQRVTFTGQLDDVRPALAAVDLFVHPGQPEPFGLVNVEAMAMEKGVVAFGYGALPEIVLDGVTGLLVAAGDETAMAQAIIVLLGDEQRRTAMGKQGRQRVEELFSIERVSTEIDAILSMIVSAGGQE